MGSAASLVLVASTFLFLFCYLGAAVAVSVVGQSHIVACRPAPRPAPDDTFNATATRRAHGTK